MTYYPSTDVLGPPTLAGYQAFLLGAGFSAEVLPPTSGSIRLSLAIATGIVSFDLQLIDPDVYTLAVYNLATDRLVNFAQDQPGQTFFGGGPGGKPPGLRQQYQINAFVSGVIASSYDEGTGETIAVPDAMKQLTLLDVQALKTPWGQQYVQFAQMIGPNVWGLT